MSNVPVLCYHAIGGPTSGPDFPFNVEPELFADHLEALTAQGWGFARFDALIAARAAGGDLPPRTVVLTFDDGFASVLHNAVPILERYGATATAFITTSFLSPEETSAPDRYLTKDEVVRLAAAGVEIGGHGHDHREHDLLDRAGLRAELAGSQWVLRSVLGENVVSYAYPYGYSNRDVRAAVEREGYRGAVGVRHALSSADDNPFDVARLRVMRQTTPERLMEWVSGRGVRVSPCSERAVTRAYRPVRYLRNRAKIRIGS